MARKSTRQTDHNDERWVRRGQRRDAAARRNFRQGGAA